MPRVTKDKVEVKNVEVKVDKKAKAVAKSASKTSKKVTSKKDSTKKSTGKVSKKVENEKVKAKKTASKVAKKVENEKVKAKKAAAKTTKKSTTTRKSIKENVVAVPEYYDLPQKYNQTMVKILAQTPKILFIYWEISDSDIENYKKEFGDNFFETTKPVLIVHNETLNYDFEVEINDFANSWYLHINDSKSTYKVELGRRPIYNDIDINADYVYISSSNYLESPNDHVLFNSESVTFRNIKTNFESKKNVSSFNFARNMNKIYNVYDLYREFYKSEGGFESLANPSSYSSSKFI